MQMASLLSLLRAAEKKFYTLIVVSGFKPEAFSL